MTHIYSHTPFSKGAKALARAVPAKRIKHRGSRFRGSPHKAVINWGAHVLPEEVRHCRVFNTTAAVEEASNKLTFFRLMQGHGLTPDYVTGIGAARMMLQNRTMVVCRTLLSSSGGKGIVVASNEAELVPAPLYVQYVKKQEEYRVHIMNGQVFDTQRKARDRGVADEDVDWTVRNHHNGFIYMREGIDTPAVVTQAAIDAFRLTSLDFGAVDVIYNSRSGRAYVLEINTAPGLEGQTVNTYAQAFRTTFNRR